MGYWSASRKSGGIVELAGEEEQGLVWGDAPADILGVAIRDIRSAFRTDMGREPLAGEIRAGLEFTLGQLEDSDSLAEMNKWIDENEEGQ